MPDIDTHYQNYQKLKQLLVRNVPILEKMAAKKQEKVKDQFIFVGSMGPERGISPLVGVFAVFQKKNMYFKLILAGPFYSSSYQKEIEDSIDKLEIRSNVLLLGQVPFKDVPGLITSSKVGMSLH